MKANKMEEPTAEETKMEEKRLENLQGKAFDRIDREFEELLTVRDKIYENPEIGGTEKFASQLLIKKLREAGFSIEEFYGGVSHAFKAVFDTGKAGTVIGIFAEYDALPEIGHGCGHNLIAATSLGAALGLSEVAEEAGGKIIVFGTPGEENLQSKTPMSAAGAFDEADVALMAHPNPVTYSSGKTLAIESLMIEFFGKSAHAGVSPAKGRNALDAAVQCYQLIHFEKQYYSDTNVYGIIKEGGQKASVIPGYARLQFLTRAWSMKELNSLREMIERCAKGAAVATGCTYKISNNEETNQPMLTNRHLADVFDRYLVALGETNIIKEDMRGSTDMADVSWRIPAIHPWVGINCPDYVLHSSEFAEKTVSREGNLFILRCSKALAATAIELITDKNLLTVVKEEFAQAVKPADVRKIRCNR